MTDNYAHPHCDPDVIHEPGACYYCDRYGAKQQAERAASGRPFTSEEANGWSGNVAWKVGDTAHHMGASFVVGDDGKPWVADHSRLARGFYCKLPDGHPGPCPTYTRWWKKIVLRVRNGVWWP